MNTNLTELVIILDRSSSMISCVDTMESALKELVDGQKQENGQTNLTFVRFDSKVEYVLENKDINEVEQEQLKLEPKGLTALHDAVGSTIDRVGKRLNDTPEENRPGLVIVAIVTDGGENSSKDYNLDQVNQLVKQQGEQYNWQFTYLGANQDAFAVGNGLGIDQGQVANYNVQRSQSMMKKVGGLVSNIRATSFSGGDIGACSYTDEDRQEIV